MPARVRSARYLLAAVVLLAMIGPAWSTTRPSTVVEIGIIRPAAGPVAAVTGFTGTEPLVAEPSAARIDTAMVTAVPAVSSVRSWCRDTAHALERWKVKGAFSWYYNPAGAPSNVARTAPSAIDTATRAIVAGRNDCGWTRGFRTAASYRGTSRATVGVSASGACTGDDGRSVTGWKRLSGGALAITCTYYEPGSRRVVSSDVAINTRYRWFTTRPAVCTGTFDLVGVLTHERGHTFGLAHVSPYRHRGQTMVTAISSCSTAERTLAGGDYAGLRRLYGLR